MLFLARFQGDLLPVVLDVPSTDGEELAAVLARAIARVEAETSERPATIQPVPPGLLFVEVKFATLDDPEAELEASGGSGHQGNPANLADMGVVCEPFESFAEWLELVDDEPLPAVLALAPTEPPLEEGGTNG